MQTVCEDWAVTAECLRSFSVSVGLLCDRPTERAPLSFPTLPGVCEHSAAPSWFLLFNFN